MPGRGPEVLTDPHDVALCPSGDWNFPGSRFLLHAAERNNLSHGQRPWKFVHEENPAPAGRHKIVGFCAVPTGLQSCYLKNVHGLSPVAKVVSPLRGEATDWRLDIYLPLRRG